MKQTKSANPASLKGKNVAILATDGFEQSELTEPRRALDQAGAKTVVIAPKPGSIRGWKSKDWGDKVAVDLTISDADPTISTHWCCPAGS
jgi:protease I